MSKGLDMHGYHDRSTTEAMGAKTPCRNHERTNHELRECVSAAYARIMFLAYSSLSYYNLGKRILLHTRPFNNMISNGRFVDLVLLLITMVASMRRWVRCRLELWIHKQQEVVV